MKKLILLTIFSSLFFGCGKRELIKLTLVFDAPINKGKYPSYFKDIVMPFESEKCETDFLLKPINVVRLDINKSEKETNAWFFENTGDNTIDFSKGWLTHYFTDSLTAKYLVKKPVRKTIGIEGYLKNEETQVLLFSEDSDLNEYKGFQIYSSAKDINNKIKEFSCDNKSKEVVVIINPIELKSDEGGGDPTTIGGPEPCNLQTVPEGLDLKYNLMNVVDTQNSYKERDQIAKMVWEKYFDPMASVKMYLKPDQKYPDFWESGDGQNYFIDRLAIKSSITDINITRIEFHKDTGKISSIIIVECHNASEI